MSKNAPRPAVMIVGISGAEATAGSTNGLAPRIVLDETEILPPSPATRAPAFNIEELKSILLLVPV